MSARLWFYFAALLVVSIAPIWACWHLDFIRWLVVGVAINAIPPIVRAGDKEHRRCFPEKYKSFARGE